LPAFAEVTGLSVRVGLVLDRATELRRQR
jgi:hypothetical protein